MVSLTNQARLLAAQEFNRRVLEARAKAGKKIKVSVKRAGVLTGRIARTDKTGRVVGLTKTKSGTRLNTERLLRKEIETQARLASRETDLERFLKNERRLASGTLSLKQIRRDIARRKAKGLSKSPAQKAALARAIIQQDTRRLGARAGRKKLRGIRPSLIDKPSVTLAKKRAEAERARIDDDFQSVTDPFGRFGGRSRKEVIARGGTFGRRVGGEAFSTQLDFVRSARVGSAQRRIGFAQSLLGDPFGGAASSQLLGIVDSQVPSRDPVKRRRGALSQRRLAPRPFENILREGVGFFETEAIPVTRRGLTRRERGLPSTRRARPTRASLEAQGLLQPRGERIRVLGTQITARGRQGLTAEVTRRPSDIFISGVALSPTGQRPAARPTKAGVDPAERLRLAQERQAETELIRATPFAQPPPLTPATGRPTTTQTFLPTLPIERRRADVTLQETFGFGDVLGGTRRKPSKKQKRREQIDVLGQMITVTPQRRQQSFLESLFGGGTLVESRTGGVKVTTGEAVREAGSPFGGGFDFSNLFQTGRGLASGTLLEAGGVTISTREAAAQAQRATREEGRGGFFDLFNFLRF